MLDFWQRTLATLTLDELEQMTQILEDAIAERRMLTVLDELDADNEQVVERHRRGSVYYQLELVRCGKLLCRCMLDGPRHGPYWYAYHYRRKGETYQVLTGRGKNRSTETRTAKKNGFTKRYIGKRRPSALDDQQAARGSGSVEQVVVDHYAALERILWQTIRAGDYTQARAIASRLGDVDEWAHLIDHYEQATQRRAEEAARCPNCHERYNGTICQGRPISERGDGEGMGHSCDPWLLAQTMGWDDQDDPI